MSSFYLRVQRQLPAPKTYGFEKVNHTELQDILNRVTKSTYSNRLMSTDEQKGLNNYGLLLYDNKRRQTASACGRRSVGSTSTPDSGERRPKRLSERDMTRLLRRLQKPTNAFVNAHKATEDLESVQEQKLVRSKSADVKNAKAVAKLRRPTTATLAKTVDVCHLCYDHENKKQGPRGEKPESDPFDFDYGDHSNIPPEEMDFIVERMMEPTYSAGIRRCHKSPKVIDEVEIRKNLPLLSGLTRSKNVDEITNRLYNQRRHHGYHAQATAITVYQ